MAVHKSAKFQRSLRGKTPPARPKKTPDSHGFIDAKKAPAKSKSEAKKKAPAKSKSPAKKKAPAKRKTRKKAP